MSILRSCTQFWAWRSLLNVEYVENHVLLRFNGAIQPEESLPSTRDPHYFLIALRFRGCKKETVNFTYSAYKRITETFFFPLLRIYTFEQIALPSVSTSTSRHTILFWVLVHIASFWVESIITKSFGPWYDFTTFLRSEVSCILNRKITLHFIYLLHQTFSSLLFLSTSLLCCLPLVIPTPHLELLQTNSLQKMIERNTKKKF